MNIAKKSPLKYIREEDASMKNLLVILLFISTTVFGFEEYGEYEEEMRDQKNEKESNQNKLKNTQNEEQIDLNQIQDSYLKRSNNKQQPQIKEIE